MDKIIIIILFFLSLLGFTFYQPMSVKPSIYENERWESRDYIEEEEEEIEEVEPEETTTQENYEYITQIKPSDLKNTKGDYILILTGTTCPHCHQYKPVLNQVLSQYNITAYEIDMWQLNESEKK